MAIQYVKRNQMEFDFKATYLPPLRLPPGFRLVLWNRELIPIHADIKHRGFRNDPDAEIFPTFRSAERCQMLMEAIAASRAFLPEATVLIAWGDDEALLTYSAAIQGSRHSKEVGGIHNVAVLPEWRRRGLGSALLIASLHGFRNAGVEKVTLEVTADNIPAVRLYEGLGFTTYRIYFREIFPDR